MNRQATIWSGSRNFCSQLSYPNYYPSVKSMLYLSSWVILFFFGVLAKTSVCKILHLRYVLDGVCRVLSKKLGNFIFLQQGRGSEHRSPITDACWLVAIGETHLVSASLETQLNKVAVKTKFLEPGSAAAFLKACHVCPWGRMFRTCVFWMLMM